MRLKGALSLSRLDGPLTDFHFLLDRQHAGYIEDEARLVERLLQRSTRLGVEPRRVLHVRDLAIFRIAQREVPSRLGPRTALAHAYRHRRTADHCHPSAVPGAPEHHRGHLLARGWLYLSRFERFHVFSFYRRSLQLQLQLVQSSIDAIRLRQQLSVRARFSQTTLLQHEEPRRPA